MNKINSLITNKIKKWWEGVHDKRWFKIINLNKNVCFDLLAVLTIKINKIKWVRKTIEARSIPSTFTKIISKWNGELVTRIPGKPRIRSQVISLRLGIEPITMNIPLKSLSRLMLTTVKLQLFRPASKNLNPTKFRFSRSWSDSTKSSEIQNWSPIWSKLIGSRLKVLKVFTNLPPRAFRTQGRLLSVGLKRPGKNRTIKSFRLPL